jgi:hypothetical protein
VEDTLTCPVCGETNPADLVLCRNCQWPLRSTTGSEPPAEGAIRSDDSASQESTDWTAIPDWLRDLGSDAGQSTAPEPVIHDEMPAGSAPHAVEETPPELPSRDQRALDEVPEWVARIAGTTAADTEPGSEISWGKTEARHDEVPAGAEATEPTSGLATSGQVPTDEESRPAFDESISKPTASGGEDEIYEWLRRLDASSPAGGDVTTPSSKPNAGVPDNPTRGQAVPVLPAEVIPDWLSEESMGGGLTAQAGTDVESVAPQAGPAAADEMLSDAAAEVPEWASSTLSGIDVDAVVASMQTPDWLSEGIPRAAASDERLPPAAREQEPIPPAELPSWVQAMQPVESIMQAASGGAAEEAPVERGPLLGLKGVLPAIPGVGKPSSKPQVRAMRLEVTEQQRARAAMLEEILVGETKPIPLKAASLLGSNRSLRWALAAMLVVILGGALASRSQSFPLPLGVPNETLRAIQSVENIPADARVLVVFDYEPATVGEMEASAASLMDHLLLLRHPVLALISTSPTGSVLAERFMQNTLASRAYQPGVGYVNLGYLPGGLAGVRAFAGDPLQTVPLGADAGAAWESPALQSVAHLSDFAAILVLSDSLESSRVWIEQTAADRGQAPMVVVSSAQAGPMLLPYAESGQVAGLVAGLNGAAGTEMANGGLPGFVRRYWDAYSLGMQLAAFMIILGGAWYAWTEMRARRAPVGI